MCKRFKKQGCLCDTKWTNPPNCDIYWDSKRAKHFKNCTKPQLVHIVIWIYLLCSLIFQNPRGIITHTEECSRLFDLNLSQKLLHSTLINFFSSFGCSGKLYFLHLRIFLTQFRLVYKVILLLKLSMSLVEFLFPRKIPWNFFDKN